MFTLLSTASDGFKVNNHNMYKKNLVCFILIVMIFRPTEAESLGVVENSTNDQWSVTKYSILLD